MRSRVMDGLSLPASQTARMPLAHSPPRPPARLPTHCLLQMLASSRAFVINQFGLSGVFYIIGKEDLTHGHGLRKLTTQLGLVLGAPRCPTLLHRDCVQAALGQLSAVEVAKHTPLSSLACPSTHPLALTSVLSSGMLPAMASP